MKNSSSVLEQIELSIGQKYGRLTILGFGGYQEVDRGTYIGKYPMAHVVCDCGVKKNVLFLNISKRKTTSCGCYSREVASKRFYKHGQNRDQTREFQTWSRMISRCHNPKGKDHPDYGGRGITVCENWRGGNGFINFFNDMGLRPSNKHSLDRIDNNKGYSKENCRWATTIEQATNKRNNVYYLINGKKLTVGAIERELNFNTGTIKGRLWRGWSIEDAISKPLMYKRKIK